MTQHSTASASIGTIVCRNCQGRNQLGRKFCAQCGFSLVEKCPKCPAEIVPGEMFCGQCGCNVKADIDQRELEIGDRFVRAQELADQSDFDAAIEEIRPVAELKEIRFASHAQRAFKMLEKLVKLRDKAIENVNTTLKNVKFLFEAASYDRAYELLGTIPESLRPHGYDTLVDQVRERRNEVLQLSGEIRELVAANRHMELFPKLERLLMIKPNHEQAKKLVKNVRDHAVAAAKKRLAAGRYDEARKFVEMIPQAERTDEANDLLDKASELDGLVAAAQFAPFADTTTLGIGQRLARMLPGDARIQQMVGKLSAAHRSSPSDPRSAFAPWAAPPKSTRIGAAIDILGTPVALGPVNEQAKTTLGRFPGQFYTAFGSALQAIQAATVEINFISKPESLLGSLFQFGGPPNGWGLDLSDSGLKAICLRPDKESFACLEVVAIPYRKLLAAAANEEERGEIVLDALVEFKSKFDLAKCRIVAAVPGSKVMARYVDLPPMTEAKLKAAVEFQVKQEIPLPLTEIKWDWAEVSHTRNLADKERNRHVMLAAAKEVTVAEWTRRFERAGIPLNAVTIDSLAIHNAFVHDFARQPNSHAVKWPVALVDIGVASTNLLVIRGPNSPWIRSFTPAGIDFNEILVRSMQLTHDKAEQLKRDPAQAPRFYQLLEEFGGVFVRFETELKRSFEQAQRVYREIEMEKIHFLGGGSQTVGLLKYLTRG